jgi:hypothetical protein
VVILDVSFKILFTSDFEIVNEFLSTLVHPTKLYNMGSYSSYPTAPLFPLAISSLKSASKGNSRARHGSRGRAHASQMQSPDFKLQYHQNQKNLKLKK